ncbi:MULTISPECIES: hypothetical protein [Streptomyces]|nr:hypothetical protein OG478_51120 [Streptomyces phaeochromogenes]
MKRVNTACDVSDVQSDAAGRETTIEPLTPEEWRAAILSTVETD